MPPVGAYVSALSVISERTTASPQRPPYVQRPHHVRQKRSVSATLAYGSIGRGRGWCDGKCVSTKGTRSPRESVKLATVVKSTPRVSTADLSSKESGPAVARSASSTRRTHGVTTP